MDINKYLCKLKLYKSYKRQKCDKTIYRCFNIDRLLLLLCYSKNIKSKFNPHIVTFTFSDSFSI